MMKKFLIMALFAGLLGFIGCGDDDDDDSPAPTPAPDVKLQEFNALKPTLEKSCAGAKCHSSGTPRDNVIASADGLINSSALAKVEGGGMPKPGSPQAEAFTEDDKKAIVGFINKHKAKPKTGY